MAVQDTATKVKELGRRLAAIGVRREALKSESAALDLEQQEILRLLGQLAITSVTGESQPVATAPAATPASALPPLAAGTRGQGERLLALLKEKPGATQQWLAEKLYGDTKATGRLSSLLDYLRKTKKARARGDGTWEAVP
jgi:hypothetical protein